MRVLGVIAVVLGVSGCFFTSPSNGENGIVELAYDEGLFGCLFGCDARDPMATDANTYLNVTNADELTSYEPFVVSSNDESVLEFIQDNGAGDSSIRVISHAPGAARIVFNEETSGELIDRYQINVEQIQNIDLSSPTINSRLLIMVGGSTTIYLDLRDASDRQLKGYGGVDYVLTGGLSEAEVTLTSALADAIVRAFAGSTRESASIVAVALGEGQIDITARTGGATFSIPAGVVDASAVANIQVENGEAEPGSTVSVSAHAFDASGEEIQDPLCEWSFTGANVTSDSSGRNNISLASTVATTGTATCTIGSQTATGNVVWRMAAP